MKWKDVVAPSFLWAHRLRIGATLLFLAGLGMTIWLAVWASIPVAPNGTSAGPTAAQSAILVIIAAIFQTAAAWAFSKASAAPAASNGMTLEASRVAVRDMARTIGDAGIVLKIAEAVGDERDKGRRETRIGELISATTWVERNATGRLEGWLTLYPHLAAPSTDVAAATPEEDK